MGIWGSLTCLRNSPLAAAYELCKPVCVFCHSALQKVSGLPEEAVPQTMARKLQPYVSKMQKDGYDDRMHL